MTRAAQISLLLLLLTISLPSISSDFPNSSKAALAWLERIAAAPRQYNYTGTFVYYADEHMETSHIVHIVDEQSEKEKIEVLDGLPRVVVRNNDEMRCYLPESKTIITEKRWLRKFFPDMLPLPFSGLDENYYVSKGKRERVTGYDCQVIILEPRDNLRYGHKLWVDTETGLVLKVAVMDADKVVEQFAFSQLEIGKEVSAELLKYSHTQVDTTAEWHTHDLITSVLDSNEPGWQVKNPPSGFKKIIEMKRNLAGKSVLIDHIALSDGLATVSVFIEPISDETSSAIPGFYSSRGAINIYVRMLADKKVTTVGEVPLETVKKIGDAVFKDTVEINASKYVN